MTRKGRRQSCTSVPEDGAEHERENPRNQNANDREQNVIKMTKTEQCVRKDGYARLAS